ncbi:hypothetical protein [Subsaximicrobium wynnwilliamsii]|nr:hypothetical protein [Subsaximicrobium wynnwilliamsii]
MIANKKVSKNSEDLILVLDSSSAVVLNPNLAIVGVFMKTIKPQNIF